MKVTWSDDFTSLYKTMGQQRYGIRLLALWKVQSGMSTKAVAALLGKTEKTVRLWRKSYEGGGVEALMSLAKGRGLKPKIKDQETLKHDIQELQNSRKGGRVKCSDVINMLEKKYNRKYSMSGTYEILHRLGFSWITSRSIHPKSNPATQEDFKKNF